MNIYLGPTRSIETNISKTAVFTMKEVFGPFFFVLSSATNLKEQIIGVYRLIRQFLWILSERFLGPKRLLKSRILEKKGKHLSEEKILAYFFLVISNMRTVSEHFIRVHKVF